MGLSCLGKYLEMKKTYKNFSASKSCNSAVALVVAWVSHCERGLRQGIKKYLYV